MRASPLSPAPLSASLLALLLPLSGCCGGYAVVSTTVHDHAEVDGHGMVAGSGAVLHYSRLGEPLNACGSGKKYVEDLWIQVPSATPGSAFTIGAPGVTALYTRASEGSQAREEGGVTGFPLRIKEQKESGLAVVLDVTIKLPSGDAVRLDDEYAFHPRASP